MLCSGISFPPTALLPVGGEAHLLLIMEFRCPPLERKADFNLQSGNQISKPNVFFF